MLVAALPLAAEVEAVPRVRWKHFVVGFVSLFYGYGFFIFFNRKKRFPNEEVVLVLAPLRRRRQDVLRVQVPRGHTVLHTHPQDHAPAGADDDPGRELLLLRQHVLPLRANVENTGGELVHMESLDAGHVLSVAFSCPRPVGGDGRAVGRRGVDGVWKINGDYLWPVWGRGGAAACWVVAAECATAWNFLIDAVAAECGGLAVPGCFSECKGAATGCGVIW